MVHLLAKLMSGADSPNEPPQAKDKQNGQKQGWRNPVQGTHPEPSSKPLPLACRGQQNKTGDNQPDVYDEAKRMIVHGFLKMQM